MSFWLLIVACIPCNDNKECSSPKPEQVSATTSHHQHNHQTEHCSPFCICSCCASSVFYASSKPLDIPYSISITQEYAYFNIAPSSKISFGIWQPPRLI